MNRPLDETDYDWPGLLRLQLGEPASFAPNKILSTLEISPKGRLCLGARVRAGQLLFACRAWVLDSRQSFGAKVESVLRVCPEWESERFHCLSGGSASASSSTQPSPLLLREDASAPAATIAAAGAGRQQHQASVREVSSEATQRRALQHALALDAMNDDGAASKVDKVGLWFPAVCLGQSCMPNVCYHFYGDLMVCRAARDLPAGDELAFCRVSSLQPHHIRTEALWGLSLACSCSRCQLEEMCMDRDGTIQLMARLDAILENLASGTSREDTADALEDLTRRAHKIVQDATKTLYAMISAGDGAARDVCARLGCSVDGKMRPVVFNVLSASFLPIYLVMASLKRSLGQCDQSALWHEACNYLLELVDRCSLLHVHWALAWAEELRKKAVAQKSTEDVDAADAVVRETVRWHYGKDPNLLKELVKRCPEALDLQQCQGQGQGQGQGAVTETTAAPHRSATSSTSASDASDWRAAAALGAEAGAAAQWIVSCRDVTIFPTIVPEDPFVWEISQKDDSCVVLIQVPDGLRVDEISLEVSSKQVLASTPSIQNGEPLTVELPFPVNHNDLLPARFKKKGRWLSMELPFLK